MLDMSHEYRRYKNVYRGILYKSSTGEHVKKLLFFISFTFFLSNARATSPFYYGTIGFAPSSVKVRAEDGTIKEYLTPSDKSSLLVVDNQNNKYMDFALRWGVSTGVTAPCLSYLGQLVEKIIVKVDSEKDTTSKTAVITQSTVVDRSAPYISGRVDIYGTCKSINNQLNDIIIYTSHVNGTIDDWTKE
jgi:hypothetical protein